MMTASALYWSHCRKYTSDPPVTCIGSRAVNGYPCTRL